jgi:hypothetical protein
MDQIDITLTIFLFQEYLYSIATDPVKSKVCKQRTLCHTIAGNPVPLLTITSPSISPNEAQVYYHCK